MHTCKYILTLMFENYCVSYMIFQSFHVLVYNHPFFCPKLFILNRNLLELVKPFYLMVDARGYIAIYTLI